MRRPSSNSTSSLRARISWASTRPCPLRGDNARAGLRQRLLKLLVDVLFKTQTALEPAAAPRYLGRIERRFLQLGHPHRYRRHHRHVSVAAHRLAAVAIVGQQLGLVTHADLAHFDARAILAGQVLDQLAEIDALLGQEKEDHPLAAEEMFDVDELHLQLTLLDELLAALQGALFPLAGGAGLGKVFGAHDADDLARRRFSQELNGAGRGLTQDLGHLDAALGTNQHVLTARIRCTRCRLIVAQKAHDAMTDDVIHLLPPSLRWAGAPTLQRESATTAGPCQLVRSL